MQMFETEKRVHANDRLDGFLCATVKKLIFFSTKFPCSREEGRGFDSQPITKVAVIDSSSSSRRGGSMYPFPIENEK